MEGPFLRKYGVETTIDFELFEIDGVNFRTDAVAAAADIQIMKDEGAEANTTNTFTDEGTGYSIVLTATEMQAARIKLYIVDAATKVWLDKSVTVETYGNASAMHAFDLDTASAAQTGDNFARLGAPTGASVSADIVVAQTDLDTITGAAGALLDTTATSAQLVDDVWDEVLTGGTHNVATSSGRRLRTLQDFGLYEGGAVWLDTVNGTAGTTDFENGTVTNPVDTIADALTIRASVGLPAIHSIPGSTFTLAASVDNIEFRGEGYTVALGGQSISGASFYNALQITGNDDGSNTTKAMFQNCTMNSSTLGLHKLRWCGLGGDIVLAEAGVYDWIDCHSQVAGTSTPSVDVGAVPLNTNLNVRDYSGGLEVKNLGQAGTDTMSFEGDGHLVINANCQNTTISVKGNIEVTDNGTSMTISDAAAYNAANVNAQVDTALADYDGPTNAELNTRIPAVMNLTASGNIGIDWANVENPTTALDLSATDIQLCDTVTTNTDAITVADILTTAMTEAYNTDGSPPTVAEALHLIIAFLMEKSKSGTALTAKKLDGSTTAATFALDNATTPTSITRDG